MSSGFVPITSHLINPQRCGEADEPRRGAQTLGRARARGGAEVCSLERSEEMWRQ